MYSALYNDKVRQRQTARMPTLFPLESISEIQTPIWMKTSPRRRHTTIYHLYLDFFVLYLDFSGVLHLAWFVDGHIRNRHILLHAEVFEAVDPIRIPARADTGAGKDLA